MGNEISVHTVEVPTVHTLEVPTVAVGPPAPILCACCVCRTRSSEHCAFCVCIFRTRSCMFLPHWSQLACRFCLGTIAQTVLCISAITMQCCAHLHTCLVRQMSYVSSTVD